MVDHKLIIQFVKSVIFTIALMAPLLASSQTGNSAAQPQTDTADLNQTCFSGSQYGFSPKDVMSACQELLGRQNLTPSDRANVLNSMGLSAAGSSDYEGAIRHYDAALQALPNYKYPLQNKANALVNLNRCAEAFTLFEQSVKQYPDSYPGLFGLGDALACQGKYKEALKYYTDASIEAPHVDSYYRTHARAQLITNDPKKAIEDIDSAIRLNPKEKTYLYQAALIGYGAGDLVNAKKRTEEYIAAVPNEPYSVIILYLIQLRSKVQDTKILQTQLNLYKDKTEWLPALMRYLLGDVSESELFTRSKQGDANLLKAQFIDFHFYVGETLLIKGDKSGAEKHFTAATQDPAYRTYAEFWLALARLKEFQRKV